LCLSVTRMPTYTELYLLKQQGSAESFLFHVVTGVHSTHRHNYSLVLTLLWRHFVKVDMMYQDQDLLCYDHFPHLCHDHLP